MNQATLNTSMGDIVIELFPNHAPKTVTNFVELATGAKEWVDPNIGEKVKTNLYDNYFSQSHSRFYDSRW